MKLSNLRQLTQNVPDLQGPALQQWLQEQLSSMGMDPSTIYQELEMTSRYVDTHRDISYSNAQLQLHSHAFYELLFCCNSCGAEYLVGSQRYRLQEGDVIFVPPGVSHRPLLPERLEKPYERYVLWLSQEFMDRYANLFPYPFTEKQAQPSMLRADRATRAKLGELFLAGIREAQQRSDGWESVVVGNTMQLLTYIKRATDARTAAMPAEKPELLDRITAYIEGNFSRGLTVGEVSGKFYVSSSTVSHLFRHKLGVSFYRYVTQRRLIAAKTLIEQGELLENVANQTGFLDYSGFYRAFKQEFGISPRQYRKLCADTAQKHLTEK